MFESPGMVYIGRCCVGAVPGVDGEVVGVAVTGVAVIGVGALVVVTGNVGMGAVVSGVVAIGVGAGIVSSSASVVKYV